MSTPHTVLVLGASPNRRRYSNEAVRQLQSLGYRVIPVHPVADEIEGLPVVHRLDEVSEPVDTLALYLGPQRSAGLAEAMVATTGRRTSTPYKERAVQGLLFRMLRPLI